MQKITLRKLTDADVSGKRVLLRASLNVPVDVRGAVSDDFRLRRGLRTVEYLASRGAKVVIVGYFGRAGDTLRPIAEALTRLLPSLTVHFSDEALSAAPKKVAALKEGECLVLENIRREAGEETNSPILSAALAALADIFVDDAFAEAHRDYASNVGVAGLLPSYAGFLFEEEIERLSEALTPPPGSLAIVAGAKFETKQPLIESLLGLYSRVCVGGAIANDFLKAKGLLVGKSLVSPLPVPASLANDPRVLLPTDVVVSGGGVTRTCSVGDIHAADTVVDDGPETTRAWAREISQSPFILWNGPLGAYEKGFLQGTDVLAQALSTAAARAAVGGGDTLAALEKYTFDDARVFRSTGGGAMLEFLATGTLPALDVLRA